MMDIDEMIWRYGIEEIEVDGKRGIGARNIKTDRERAEVMERIKEIRDEIYKRNDYIKERSRRIDEMPGLKELRSARYADERWHEAFEESLDSGDSVNPARPVHRDIKEIKKQYPLAAAYLVAEAYTLSPNFMKASIGERAIDRLVMDGEDCEKVLRDMDDEWTKYCKENCD